MRLIIFHNLKNISLVVQIFGNLKIYPYRKIERERNIKQENTEKERKREITNKTNRKEIWFDFHIRCRGENIAKGLPPFSKKPKVYAKQLCYEIPNFTFNDK